MLEKIGQISYKVTLLKDAKIHRVFHVSRLNKHVGQAVIQFELPIFDEEGLIVKTPACILDKRMKK